MGLCAGRLVTLLWRPSPVAAAIAAATVEQNRGRQGAWAMKLAPQAAHVAAITGVGADNGGIIAFSPPWRSIAQPHQGLSDVQRLARERGHRLGTCG